jgi:hypothetical protein
MTATRSWAKIAAERIVQHLEQARHVVTKKPPIGAEATILAGAARGPAPLYASAAWPFRVWR